jgi:hypothetical protein
VRRCGKECAQGTSSALIGVGRERERAAAKGGETINSHGGRRRL